MSPKAKILIVDDEEQILELFELAFQDAGYDVFTAPNGESAIKMMAENAFPLVISDLNMPGMNGLELCQHIRDRWPLTIFIAVTGYSSLFELSDCREAGFEDYFRKPVKLKELTAAVDFCSRKIARWKQP